MKDASFSHRHVLGVLSVLITFVVPLACGAIAFFCYPIVVEAVGVKLSGVGRFENLPVIAVFVFTHFRWLLWGVFGVTLLLSVFSLLQLKEGDAERRLVVQLILATAGVLVGVLFLGVFISATTSALMAGLQPLL
ncbi:MAG: hypothetical protein LBS59_00370 [Puniceicoccales bacterium]|jgi:hypothetical protein|nr:hypothetical protein [Puniceicoccales bacterium]